MEALALRTGRRGQTAFQLICENAGLAANPAADDVSGWDYIVDFPAPKSATPADRAPKALTAFVQIKTTQDARRRNWSVKLSNALRFAQNDTACFTVLLVMRPADSTPRRAFIKHFWREDIEQALAAARHASVNGLPLHKKAFMIHFEDADEVQVNLLARRMEEIIRDIGAEYPSVKQTLGVEAGIVGQSLRITATFDERTPLNQLLDALVGNGGSLETTNIQVIETRFGISAQRDDLTGPGTIKVLPNGVPVDLTFKSYDGARSILLPSMAFYAAIPSSSGTHRRFRVSSEFIDLCCDLVEDGRFNVQFDFDKDYNIGNIRKLASFLAWIRAGPLVYSIDAEPGNLVRGVCQLEDEISDGWEKLCFILTDLCDIFNIDQWPHSATFLIRELFENLQEIAEFSSLLNSRASTWTFVDINPLISRNILISVPAKLGVAYLELGSVTLFAAYSVPTLKVELGDDEVRFEFGNPTILRRDVLRGGAKSNWEYMRKEIADEWCKHPDVCLREDLSEHAEAKH